jgi:hypothetical protein
VQLEWVETLLPVSLQAALEAVREFRDNGRRDAPTPGEIYRAAFQIDERAEDEKRRRMRMLMDQTKPNEEGRAKFRAILQSLTDRSKPNASEDATSSTAAADRALTPTGIALDPEINRTQQIIPEKRRTCELRRD